VTVRVISYITRVQDSREEKVFHDHIPKSIFFRHTHIKSIKLKENEIK